jgi:hypothetical protein
MIRFSLLTTLTALALVYALMATVHIARADDTADYNAEMKKCHAAGGTRETCEEHAPVPARVRGAAHGGSSKPEPESGWRINCRKVEIWYEGGEENDAQPGHLTLKDIREIEKLIPEKMRCVLGVRSTARHEVARRP